jgi:2-polyprenyl-3-methyl-5-hydroxy-6-metoxy-1,4-benzoquinol methylase
VGSGCGRNSLQLARVGFEVTAVDAAASAAEQLVTRAREEGLDIQVRCGDVTEVDYPGESYDLVVATTVLEHLPHHRLGAVADRLVEALKPGGVLLAEVFSRADPGFTGGEKASEFAGLVEHYFTGREMKEVFADLEPIRSVPLTVTDTTHGSVHRHALIRFVARKAE